MINVFQPCLGEEEVSRIREVFQSNWLGKGKLVDEFEEKYAAHLDTDKSHILTANCCSEGLFSSMHLFGIGEGDEVIVPTISFVGAGNAVCAAGAKLVLTDVDPRTLNIRPEDILAHITPRTKAILLLHFGGIPCDMDPIMEIAREHHLTVIEDSACGIYSRYKGKPLGTIGDMGMWSFDAMKILVCADGSALYFKDPAVREKAAKWLYFGLESKSGYSNSVDKKWWEYDLSCFGHRSIMNDVTAAMALEQLKKLPGFIARRHEIAAIYDSRLAVWTGWICPPRCRRTAPAPITSIMSRPSAAPATIWPSSCGTTTCTPRSATSRCTVYRPTVWQAASPMRTMPPTIRCACPSIRL